MKILIVEDDADILQFVKIGFESEGYTVDEASDGETGSYMGRVNAYDLIILDHSLPKKNGLEVCKEIRESGSDVPIIFLTILAETNRKVSALEKGADDYLTKPFSFDELKARVKALLRRPRKIEASELSLGDLSIDRQKQFAYRRGRPIYLTRKEYTLLEYMMMNPGIVLSRSMIMEHVWSVESDPFSNTVEAHIMNLRKKVNLGEKKDFIRNLPGRGYILEV